MSKYITNNNREVLFVKDTTTGNIMPLQGDSATGSLNITTGSTLTTVGNKTNNNAAPGANNIGALTGIANASAPTYTEGNQILLSTDLSGNLRTLTTIAANSSVNLNQVAGNAVATGNGVAGNAVQRVTIASDNTAFTVNAAQSGTWNINNISGTVSLPTGAATSAKQPALGTAGTASSDVITVQGIASMTKLLVTPDSVALPANQSVNVNQIGGNNVLTGNGTTGTGSQRVTIASDNTAFAVNATLSAETTKVIGVTRTADGSGNLLTSTSSALDINIKSGSIANTAFTANAGTNLNTSALALDATVAKLTIAQATALGSNTVALMGGSVTTNAPTFTTGNINQLSMTTAGGLRIDLKDTASNTNNLNVNLAASAATVTVSATNLSTNVAQINGVTPLMGNGTTGTGSLRVTVASDNTAFTVNAAQSGTWTVQPGNTANTTAWLTNSSTATGSAVPANAYYKGGIAKTALPTAATDGNLTGAMVDKFGRQVIIPGTIRDLMTDATVTISASTTETTILSAVASTFLDVTAVMVANTSATGARVDFRDATAGTVRFSLWVPPTDTRGIVFSRPRPQTTANNNWTAQSSASVTDLRVYMQAESNK